MLFLTAKAQVNCQSLRYQQPVFDSVTVSTGIYFATATPYGFLAQPQDLLLDFYEPVGDTLTKRPLIVFQFGGGFAIGWRSEPVIPQFCTYFAKCGYAVASIDYRLGFNIDSQSTTRAMYRAMQDERAALRFLCQNAQQFKIDTNIIFLTGTSAGCFSALGNCFMSEADRPAPTYGIPLEPADLGCMDCSGNTDFGLRFPKIKAIINQWGAILDTALIEASENIPIISFHGDQDVLVPYEYGFPFQLPVFPAVYGSKPIHERLDNLGILNELHPLVGYGHEPELLNAHLNDTIYHYSREFLFKLLKPATSAITGTPQVCISQTATYSVGFTAGSKYCWQLTGNGTILQSTGNTITVQWSDTGQVSVSVKELSYLDTEGDLKTFQTYVLPDVNANFAYTKSDLNVQFSNWSANASNYNWSFGDGTISTATNPVKDYTSGGTYPITLMADNGVCADTFSVMLEVDSCPVAGFTYQVSNFNGFFYASPTNTTNYWWNFGDGDSVQVSAANVLHIYSQPGTYHVTLRVENQFSCKEVAEQDITVLTTGIASLEGDYGFFCVNGNCVVHSLADVIMKLEIIDITGRVINQTNVESNKPFSLSSIPAGNYVYTLTDSNNLLNTGKISLQ